MRQLRLVLVVALVMVGACALDREEVVAGPDVVESTSPLVEGATVPVGLDPRDPIDVAGADGPPSVGVFDGATRLQLQPWATCWTGVSDGFCADGASQPDVDLRVIDQTSGPDDTLHVDFPVEGWSFEATSRPAGEECGRSQTVTLDRIAPTVFRLAPFGLAGDHAVSVFGRGPGGDVIVSFRWITAVDGPLPTPASSLSLLADHDGEVDSYGVEFVVTGLDRTPADLDASVVVTEAGGASTTLDLLPATDAGCQPEGDLFLRGSIEEALEAAALGDGPFTYDVELVLEGTVHRAIATWPDDVVEDCMPCVPLRFEPPLPALVAPGPDS